MISERTLYVGIESNVGAPITPVGVLKLAQRGVMESGEFAYGQRYLQHTQAEALNPNHLPLQSTSFALTEHRIRDGGALPLTFRDALPDSWGRRVLEGQYGRTLSDIDVLLLSNADRVGAMVFAEQLPIQSDAFQFNVQAYPSASLGTNSFEPNSQSGLISLDTLADAVRRLEFAMEITPAMKHLLLHGGSLGGARPKTTFIHDAVRWMAKFPARGDEYDVEILEAATLSLARECGIEVPQFFVQAIHVEHALLLRRFDRQGTIDNEQRFHFLSASALLNVPYESSGGSYVEFAQTLRFVSVDPMHDLHQLYRRMIFNLMIDNSDDHVKNHGMLRVSSRGYQLSPAFDLVPQLNNSGYQQLAILPGRFESHLDLAYEAAPHFGISPDVAKAIIDELSQKVRTIFGKFLREQKADTMLIDRVQVCMKKQARLITR